MIMRQCGTQSSMQDAKIMHIIFYWKIIQTIETIGKSLALTNLNLTITKVQRRYKLDQSYTILGNILNNIRPKYVHHLSYSECHYHGVNNHQTIS